MHCKKNSAFSFGVLTAGHYPIIIKLYLNNCSNDERCYYEENI